MYKTCIKNHERVLPNQELNKIMISMVRCFKTFYVFITFMGCM